MPDAPRPTRSIVVVPDVCGGKPVFSGTRITAGTILGFLGAGDSIEELVESYPALTSDDIRAALVWASEVASQPYEVRFSV